MRSDLPQLNRRNTNLGYHCIQAVQIKACGHAKGLEKPNPFATGDDWFLALNEQQVGAAPKQRTRCVWRRRRWRWLWLGVCTLRCAGRRRRRRRRRKARATHLAATPATPCAAVLLSCLLSRLPHCYTCIILIILPLAAQLLPT